jgi:hypothetical protein
MSESEERPVALRAETRLAAIPAADVVGYGRLLRRDEEGTLQQLRAAIRDVFRPASIGIADELSKRRVTDFWSSSQASSRRSIARSRFSRKWPL